MLRCGRSSSPVPEHKNDPEQGKPVHMREPLQIREGCEYSVHEDIVKTPAMLRWSATVFSIETLES